MSISAFDLFKVGIGPSSSHTVGPMLAGYSFVRELIDSGKLDQTSTLEVVLYGSLSATGHGHNTDRAVVSGLSGHQPDRVEPRLVTELFQRACSEKVLMLAGQKQIPFDPATQLIFSNETLDYHPNALRFTAKNAKEDLLAQETYYSIGGGFVVSERTRQSLCTEQQTTASPYPFTTAAELLELCRKHSLTVAELVMENERSRRSESEIRAGLLRIWTVMSESIQRGLDTEGTLPGGLKVKRRANSLHRSLLSADQPNVIGSTLSAMDWVNLYALAVNEENAAGGRMVTAPTNGAAGIIPAVLMYFMRFKEDASDEDVVDFLLAATAVGVLCKLNASISGAEVGCQGEVGSACAMAAAGLCQVLGGTPDQVENAAEIGLEHNLGLTCDPVGGLVQVPCIERNAIASVKAINAAQLALRGDGSHFVSLDKVIKTMRETGADMQDRYKETSKGGLAVNAIEC